MTRLIRVARLGMNPNAMHVLTTVLLVATPMMQVAILPKNYILALIIRLRAIVVLIFQAIMNRRGQTALRFVAQRGMRGMHFALLKRLFPISARTTRLMRNVVVIIVIDQFAGTPVWITLLPRDARAMPITICG